MSEVNVDPKNPKNDRTDRVIIAIALLGMLASAVFLLNENALTYLFGGSSYSSTKPILGEITFIENDARHKDSSSFGWAKANSKQEVRLGDGVFTGKKSRSRVTFKDGNNLDMAENTLVMFNKLNGEQLPNFAFGNFRLAVNGTMKVAIQGQITEITGNGSEIQVVIAPNKKPELRLLKGAASLKTAGIAQTVLEPNRAFALNVPRTPSLLEEPQAQPLPPPPGDPAILTKATLPMYRYIHRLYDLYEQEGPELKSKEEPSSVELAVNLAWEVNGLVDKIFVQHTNSFLFNSTPVLDGGPTGTTLTQVFVGDNYWRASSDQKKWSPTQKFTVATGPLFNEPPTFKWKQTTVVLKGLSAPITGQLLADNLLTSFVVEVARDKDFHDARIVLRNTSALQFNLSQVGTYYFRARGVNEKYELTDYSHVSAVEVLAPAPEPIRLTKKPAPPAKAKKEVAVAKQAEPTPIKRKPAAVEASNKIKVDEQSQFLNKNYAHSSLELEGAAFTMYSREELISQGKAPLGVETAIRVHHWFNGGHNGMEGTIKSSVASSVTNANETAPLGAELRYLRRWNMPWNWFSRINETQIALILGGEYFSNSGGGYFAPSYSLVKTGFSLRFPAFYHWATGGEVLYGMGFDNSHKYEVSGFIHYYLKRNWSLGGGYRVHLFEAGSDASAPANIGVPYREAYGEAYSSLLWHY